MKWINNTLASLRRLLSQPSTELGRWQRTLRFWIDLSRHCGRELRRDKASQMAAALTYHTLFSLLPTLVLTLVIMKGFVGVEQQEQFKQTVVEWMLKPLADDVASQNTTTQDKNLQERPETDNAKVLEKKVAQEEFAKSRQAIEEQIQNIFDKLATIRFGTIGVVGVLIFIYAATGLLAGIEKSFNAIYGTDKSRSWYLRLPLYYTVITLGPVVMLAGQLMQRRFLEVIQTTPWTAWFAGPLAYLSPLMTTWLVLALVYILLPNTKVKMRAAMTGSFVAALLWAMVMWGLTFYINKAAGSSHFALYGALALMPLFLMWLWLSWVIVLFGLELTYTLQAMRGRKFELEEQQYSHDLTIVDPAAVVPLAAHIAKAFQQGHACNIEDLAQQINLPTQPVTKMIDALEQANLVNKLQREDQAEYALAKPADQVKIFDLLNALNAITAGPATDQSKKSWQLVDQLRATSNEKIDQITLGQLMDSDDKPDANTP